MGRTLARSFVVFSVGILLGTDLALTVAAREIDPVQPDTDTERSLLPVFGFQYQLTDRIDVTAHGSQLIGDIDPQLALARLRYQHNETWGVGLGYFGLWQDGTASRPDPKDQRIRFEGYLALPFGDAWAFRHRSRFEHRFRDIEDAWRYRPNFRLQREVKLRSNGTITPFAYVEPFYDFNAGEITSTEYAAGLNTNLTERLNLEAWLTHTEARGDAADFDYLALIFTYALN